MYNIQYIFFTTILQRLYMLLHEFIAYKKNNIILHAVWRYKSRVTKLETKNPLPSP